MAQKKYKIETLEKEKILFEYRGFEFLMTNPAHMTLTQSARITKDVSVLLEEIRAVDETTKDDALAALEQLTSAELMQVIGDLVKK